MNNSIEKLGVSANMNRVLNSPNTAAICIDEQCDGEIQGRLYYYYRNAPLYFQTIVQMIKNLEEVYDTLGFPQKSTEERSFHEVKKTQKKSEKVKKMEKEELMEKKGEKGTFIVKVEYRQNATWQGDVIWAEKKESKKFRSALELLKIIDSAVDET